MTSAAGKWHQDDMHVWLRSARAAHPGLELHSSLGKQRWFLSPTQDQHVSGTQSTALTAAPGGQKQPASTEGCMQDGFCHTTLLYVGSCVLALVCGRG